MRSMVEGATAPATQKSGVTDHAFFERIAFIHKTKNKKN
jgi:hypothetical protein